MKISMIEYYGKYFLRYQFTVRILCLTMRLRDLGQNCESHSKTVRLVRSVEHLFEWLCCCKRIHFSLNWRMFWITHLLVNLLFWGVVTTPQTSKVKSFAKIVFSYPFTIVKKCSILDVWRGPGCASVIDLLNFIWRIELNWDIWKSNLFFSWLRTAYFSYCFLRFCHHFSSSCTKYFFPKFHSLGKLLFKVPNIYSITTKFNRLTSIPMT